MNQEFTTNIFSLPNELLEQIVGDLEHQDLENITSTCRLIRDVAAKQLKEHYRLRRKLGYKLNYPGKKALHPAEILDTIVRTPRAASYIKSLSLTYRPLDTQKDPNTSVILTKHDCFWSLLINNPHIPEREIHSWYTRIQEGHLDSIFALLICYLDDLLELRIQRPIVIPMTSLMASRLKKSLHERMLEDLSYGVLGSITDIASYRRECSGGLAKLERIIVDPAAASGEAHLRNRLGDFGRVADFAFPEVRQLNAVSLASRKYNLEQDFSGFANLRSIRLVNCNIAQESFQLLFSGINALESFHYVPTRETIDVSLVVDSLKKFAGHSLTNLYIRHRDIETRSESWRYRGFEQLKRLNLDWRGLVHFEETAVASSSSAASSSLCTEPPSSPRKTRPKSNKIQHPALVDLAPISAESIKIVDLDGSANLDAIRWLFFKLAMRISRFPKLKIIIFVTPRKDCWLHAKEICTRAGLKFPAYSCDKEKRLSSLDHVYE